MLPNIKTCANWWSKFSENLKIVALKLFELARFLSPNLSIYKLSTLILYGVRVRCDVDIFKLTASAQSTNREVNGLCFLTLWCSTKCRMCQCGWQAVPWTHNGILMRHLANPHHLYSLLSVLNCGTILLIVYSMVWDLQVSRAGPILFSWKTLLDHFCLLPIFPLFSFCLHWPHCLSVWVALA